MQGSLAMSGGWANITGSTVGWPRLPPSQAWQGLNDSAAPAISGTGLGQPAPVFPLPLLSLRLEAWEDPTRLFTPTQYSENPRDDQDHEVPRDSLKCPLQGHRLLRGSCCSYTSSSKTTQEKAILGAQQVYTFVHTHL